MWRYCRCFGKRSTTAAAWESSLKFEAPTVGVPRKILKLSSDLPEVAGDNSIERWLTEYYSEKNYTTRQKSNHSHTCSWKQNFGSEQNKKQLAHNRNTNHQRSLFKINTVHIVWWRTENIRPSLHRGFSTIFSQAHPSSPGIHFFDEALLRASFRLPRAQPENLYQEQNRS